LQGLVLGLGFGLGAVVILTVLADGGVRPAALRTQSGNNLKQIGFAIHDFEGMTGHLPNNTYAPDGRPLLSWRVHLLPFLEQENLYNQFKLDEPWDGPTNKHLLVQMPRIYARPSDPANRRGWRTYYRGFSNPGAVFERRPASIPWRLMPVLGPLTQRPVGAEKDPWPFRFTLGSVADGLANTIFVVEAGEPVEWTRPDDLDASPGQPFPKMGGFGWRNGFQAVMGDGSVRVLSLDTPEDNLRTLISYSGGEPVTPD
jgi:Protein of unknown function (DUF1559)